jgi:ABC-type uncharacterized transport system permease subunit
MFSHFLSFLALLAYGYAAFAYWRTYYPLATASSGVTECRRSPWSLRAVLVCGLLCHSAFLFLESRGLAPGSALPRFPYVASLLSVVLVAVFLLLERRLRISALGAFVSPVALLFFVLSAVFFHFAAEDIRREHSGVLLSLHFVSTLSAYVAFLLSFCSSAAFLSGESLLKRKRPILNTDPLPSLLFLDRCNRASIGIGFVLLVSGIALGSIYTELYEGSQVEFESRILWALPMVVVYGGLAGWTLLRGVRGRKLTWGAVMGFATVLLSFFGTGVHSGSFHVH